MSRVVIRFGEITIASFEELTSFLLEKVGSGGRFEITVGGDNQQHRLAGDEILDRDESAPVVIDVTRIEEVEESSDGGEVDPRGAQVEPLIRELRYEPEPIEKRRHLKWKVPAGSGALDEVRHFQVLLIDEGSESERARIVKPAPGGGGDAVDVADPVLENLDDGTYRAEVLAVGHDDTILECKIVRFVAEMAIPPRMDDHQRIIRHADRLKPVLASFQAKWFRQQPKFLVVGKQHHGKSSLINSLQRWLRDDMDLPGIARSAPPSGAETTMQTDVVSVPFSKCGVFRFVDMPAISVMDTERIEDLQNLLWHATHGVRRTGKPSLLRSRGLLPSPPDGVIVVVSLMAWRSEPGTLQEFLGRLQAQLHAIPFVVAATHRDAFLIEEGNNRRDPVAELQEALDSLKVMANQENVYAVANYGRRSWRTAAVDEAIGDMLTQLTSDATPQRMRSSKERLLEAEACCAGLAAALHDALHAPQGAPGARSLPPSWRAG